MPDEALEPSTRRMSETNERARRHTSFGRDGSSKPVGCLQYTRFVRSSWRNALDTSSWWAGHYLEVMSDRTVRIVVGFMTGEKVLSKSILGR